MRRKRLCKGQTAQKDEREDGTVRVAGAEPRDLGLYYLFATKFSASKALLHHSLKPLAVQRLLGRAAKDISTRGCRYRRDPSQDMRAGKKRPDSNAGPTLHSALRNTRKYTGSLMRDDTAAAPRPAPPLPGAFPPAGPPAHPTPDPLVLSFKEHAFSAEKIDSSTRTSYLPCAPSTRFSMPSIAQNAAVCGFA